MIVDYEFDTSGQSGTSALCCNCKQYGCPGCGESRWLNPDDFGFVEQGNEYVPGRLVPLRLGRARQGWVCPNCKRGMAPHMPWCDCTKDDDP